MLFVAVFILPCKMPEKGFSLHPFDGKYEEGFLNPMEACQPNYSITSDDEQCQCLADMYQHVTASKCEWQAQCITGMALLWAGDWKHS